MSVLITCKSGNLDTSPLSLPVDYIDLEWYETKKRIQNKRSRQGLEVTLKFLDEFHQLYQNDILLIQSDCMIAVNILECETIIISPRSMAEMASICYEIGNKHLPLFYQGDKLLISFEKPIYSWLINNNFPVLVENRKLEYPVKTTVLPHRITVSDNVFEQFKKIPSSDT